MAQPKDIFCVIMAGGVGSRFWPMSRQSHPKQFLDVLGTGKTLLQQTVERFLPLIPLERIIIVTNKAYETLVHEQIPGLNTDQVLLEPARRNTAPCLAYAAHKIQLKNPNALLVVAPSDHLILKETVFIEHLKSAFDFSAENDALLTMGIRPGRPDTGYGYIQFTDDPDLPYNSQVKKVKTFTEKPNLELAKSFVASGEFLWNAGIFIWSLQSLMKAMENYMPDVNQLFAAGKTYYYTTQEQAYIEQAYARCTNISIDYGIMEKAPNVYVIPSDFGWSDLGTWGSLYENSPKDKHGNTVIGKNVMLYNSNQCIINVPHEKLVAIQGLEGYIVAESDDILLICKKDEEQEIRQIVNNVKADKGEAFV
ncbi:MAG: NTP transferase domain-containing protein [Bacteroidia bacterium]|jgi:mannose-1-phosphate guanylyltransferase|nr:mannose-1-phosphate guanylyltransferase [Bacteroidia bacterium]MCC6769089.1 NTP transferase domain-containing protein [Bacteroidia bacterium]